MQEYTHKQNKGNKKKKTSLRGLKKMSIADTSKIWIQMCGSENFSFKTCIFPFREGNGTPFQYSCLENSMDGGVW